MKILPPTVENIAKAAEALRFGLLVGMPTETVYGLAANALDRKAVAATFSAKGRPVDNPLIVHLSDFLHLPQVAADIPAEALKLARAFWPGPLTLVLPKRPEVPETTTGGLDTVAVRVPGHPIARTLIAAAAVPISAPSANPFMGLSPTRAEHIDASLMPWMEMVLDGGPCAVGLESTVLDLTESPTLLRPGGVTLSDIEEVLGQRVAVGGSARRAPGMYPRHYAPRTRVRIVEELGDRTGLPLQGTPEEYGANLYARLHELDAQKLEEILVEAPPETEEWAAVWDRLRRASFE